MGVRQNRTYLAAPVASALIGGDAGGLQRSRPGYAGVVVSRPDAAYARVVQVALDVRVRALQPEGGLYCDNDFGGLKTAVGVDDEAPRRLFIDDPAARPIVVFGRCNLSGKPERCEPRRSQPTPLLPPLIVAGRVGQAIAVGLCLREGRKSATRTCPTRQKMPTEVSRNAGRFRVAGVMG